MIDYNKGVVEYRNTANYKEDRKEQETNNLPSETIEGQAMSIQKLVERSQGGIAPEQKNYQYFDQDDLDLINGFYQPNIDLTDLDEFDAHIQSFNDAVKKAIDNRDNPTEPEPVPDPEPTPEPPV